MFKFGDRVEWYDGTPPEGTVLRSDVNFTEVEWDSGSISEKRTRYLRLIPSFVPITITKPTWKDLDDSSTFQDILPGIHAAVTYAADGPCWEWAVGAHRDAAVGQGRSIDRVTAKADAEFFAKNYNAEDTSERDDIRRRLNKSWGYT